MLHPVLTCTIGGLILLFAPDCLIDSCTISKDWDHTESSSRSWSTVILSEPCHTRHSPPMFYPDLRHVVVVYLKKQKKATVSPFVLADKISLLRSFIRTEDA